MKMTIFTPGKVIAVMHSFFFKGIHGKKIKSGKVLYEVKWENYKKTTWEPAEHIPSFILNYYERTGNKNIPAARVKNTKVVGMVNYSIP